MIAYKIKDKQVTIKRNHDENHLKTIKTIKTIKTMMKTIKRNHDETII